MADEKTGPDSLRIYHTGASSHAAAQADANASVGNYRASTLATILDIVETNPIANVTVAFASGNNGEGNGSLTATDADTLAYTAPGGTQGAGVAIANGETKIVQDGTTASKYVRVTRTSADNLSGTVTLTYTIPVNNVMGFDDVSSAEATAGDLEQRCLAFVNDHASDAVTAMKFWIISTGTERTADAAQLAASGADTIQTTGSLADWDEQGHCRIDLAAAPDDWVTETAYILGDRVSPTTPNGYWYECTTAGTTAVGQPTWPTAVGDTVADGTVTWTCRDALEIVYYSSRTDTVLTVPANGRARLGTVAHAGAATDKIRCVPGIRIAKEDPSAQPSGYYENIAEGGSPASINKWRYAIASTETDVVALATLAAGNQEGLRIQRDIITGHIGLAGVLQSIGWTFDTP